MKAGKTDQIEAEQGAEDRKIIRRIAVLIAAIGLMAVLTGCGGTFGVVMNDETNVEITAENADADSSGTVDTFTVGENADVVIEPDLSKGSIQVQFIPFEGASDEDVDVEEAAAGEPVFETEVSGSQAAPCELAPGEYKVTANVLKEADGTVAIRAVEGK